MKRGLIFIVLLGSCWPLRRKMMVYIFWAALHGCHRFLRDILRLARQWRVEFAFPTQSVYLKRGDKPEQCAAI